MLGGIGTPPVQAELLCKNGPFQWNVRGPHASVVQEAIFRCDLKGM